MTYNTLSGALLDLSKQIGNTQETQNTPQISGMTKLRKLNLEEDSLKNKKFIYKSNDFQGIVEVVDYTVEQNGHYFAMFKSGKQMPVIDLSENMIEFENFQNKTKGLNYSNDEDILNSSISKAKNFTNANDYKVIDSVPEYHEVFGKTNLKIEGLEYIDQNKTNIYKDNINPTNEFTLKNDPILLLLNSSKKNDISLSIEINAPTQSSIQSIIENFEFDNLDIKLFNYIFDNNLEKIKESFKNSLINLYKIKINQQDESTPQETVS
jgi:hypothetical protein